MTLANFWASTALVNLIAFVLLYLLSKHFFYTGRETPKWVSAATGISATMLTLSVVIAIGASL